MSGKSSKSRREDNGHPRSVAREQGPRRKETAQARIKVTNARPRGGRFPKTF